MLGAIYTSAQESTMTAQPSPTKTFPRSSQSFLDSQKGEVYNISLISNANRTNKSQSYGLNGKIRMPFVTNIQLYSLNLIVPIIKV